MLGLKLLPRFYRLFGRDYYIKLSFSQLALNFVVQRIFGMNRPVPFSVHYTSRYQGYHNMHIKGEAALICCAVSGGCYFTAFEGTTLEIDEGTVFAFNVCIQTGNHEHGNNKSFTTASVKIGKNCWLGNSVTVTAGVVLGDNTLVGANSVVTKSFPEGNVMIGGCPAKVIRYLESE